MGFQCISLQCPSFQTTSILTIYGYKPVAELILLIAETHWLSIVSIGSTYLPVKQTFGGWYALQPSGGGTQKLYSIQLEY